MNKGVTCRGCDHFRTCLFCGYESSNCEIHGSLDVDQHERHPDTTAATCPDFTPKVEHPPRKPFGATVKRIIMNGHRGRYRP